MTHRSVARPTRQDKPPRSVWADLGDPQLWLGVLAIGMFVATVLVGFSALEALTR